MSKKKTRRPKKELSEKQMEKLMKESRIKGAKDALVISIAVMADELNLTDRQIGKVAKRFERYVNYTAEDAVKIKDVIAIIEKETGITFGK